MTLHLSSLGVDGLKIRSYRGDRWRKSPSPFLMTERTDGIQDSLAPRVRLAGRARSCGTGGAPAASLRLSRSGERPPGGADLPPSCSGSRARWRWPGQQTGAAGARWRVGGPAPPAATGPGWARAASPVRAQGRVGSEASFGPGPVTKR